MCNDIGGLKAAFPSGFVRSVLPGETFSDANGSGGSLEVGLIVFHGEVVQGEIHGSVQATQFFFSEMDLYGRLTASLKSHGTRHFLKNSHIDFRPGVELGKGIGQTGP